MKRNQIKHFIAGDISLAMATLYCSPEEHELALVILETLSDDKKKHSCFFKNHLGDLAINRTELTTDRR